MVDLSDPWDQPTAPKRWPKIVGAILAALLVLNAILWLVQGARERPDPALAGLNDTLNEQKKQLDLLREKLFDEKRDVDNAKLYIEQGLANDRQKAADQYKIMASRYDADRLRYQSLGNEYNQNVSLLHSKEQQHSRWLLIPFPIRISVD